MDFTATFIDHDLAYNDSQRLAGRQATAAALARCKQKFSAFLDGPDLPARFDLIESDLRQTVSAVVEEYGGDFDKVLSAVTITLAKGGYCDDCKAWKSGPRAGCTCSENDGTSEEDQNDNSDDDNKTGSVRTSEYHYVKKRGNKWVIVQKGTGKILSEHDSQEKADASFRAMEMHKHEGGSDHWIQKAVKKPGELHKDLGVPEGEKIPEDKLESAEHSDNKKVRERAQFAENMKGLHHGARGNWWDPDMNVDDGPFEPDMPSRLDPTKLPVGEIAGHDDTGYQYGPDEGPTGHCPNCNGPADGPTCPHCGYSEAPGAESAGDPSQTYGGGHAMDDPEYDQQPYRNVSPNDYQGYQGSVHEAFQGPLDRYITQQTLNDMQGWLSHGSDLGQVEASSPHDILTQINRSYPNGVRGFISDNDPSYRDVNGPYTGSWEGKWRVAANPQVHDGIGAVERESVDTGEGPEPKMDKKRWKPNALNPDGNLEPIDTDMSDTRHPTEHQDIAQVPDHTKDFREQTKGGETRETLKGTDSFDGSGFNKEKNITQYPTRTFGDKGQQPSGVGHEAFPKNSANGDCPNCGANPDSETRCSVCKGWPSAHEGSVDNTNSLEEYLDQALVS